MADFPAENHDGEQVYLRAQLANWSNCSHLRSYTLCSTQPTHI